MTEEQFWTIVDEIGWPDVDDDTAKRRFMERQDKSVAEEFRNWLMHQKARRRRAGNVQAVCDSWGDLLVHVFGLGKKEYYRTIESPQTLFEGEACQQRFRSSALGVRTFSWTELCRQAYARAVLSGTLAAEC